MADIAYTFFFSAVCVGGASLLHLSVANEWRRVEAALRGQPFQELPASPTAGTVSVSERHQPILQPVAISICRI